MLKFMNGVGRAELNQWIGWALLLGSFACSVWLARSSAASGGSSIDMGRKITVRHGNVMLAGMAFLQLTVAQVMKRSSMAAPRLRSASLIIAAGGILYGVGISSVLPEEKSFRFVISGALTSLAGLAILLKDESAFADHGANMAFWIFCFGLALEAVTGALNLKPDVLPYGLGAEDGLRLRMLRLARISSFALPALVCLFHRLDNDPDSRGRIADYGRIAISWGALGIPLVLAVASFTSLKFRVLAAVPAHAVFAGTLIAWWLARGQNRCVEAWGWVTIALSMGMGMLMGLYAFGALLQPPAWIGSYNDSGRILLRQAHVYSIMCGLMTLFAAAQLAAKNATDRPQGR